MTFDSGKMYWWLQTLDAYGQGSNVTSLMIGDQQGVPVRRQRGANRIVSAGGIEIRVAVSGTGGLIAKETQQAGVRIAVKYRNAVAIAVQNVEPVTRQIERQP